MRKLIAASVVILLATFSHAQAQGFAEMKASGVPGKATATRTATLTATIKAIDAATRSVTLQNQAGATQTIKVGPQVQRFDEFAVGDTILVVVEQGLVLEYQSAGTPAVAPTAVVAGTEPDRTGRPKAWSPRASRPPSRSPRSTRRTAWSSSRDRPGPSTR